MITLASDKITRRHRELERRWEVALQAVVEAREEMERMASHPQIPELTAEMKGQLQDLGRHLPQLWANGCLAPAQQKDILRSLIRRIIVTRPTPDTVEARVVWVSGAVTPFSVHPPISRGSDVSGYERLVERILTLGAQGHKTLRSRGSFQQKAFVPLAAPASLLRWWGRSDEHADRSPSPNSSRRKPRSREDFYKKVHIL